MSPSDNMCTYGYCLSAEPLHSCGGSEGPVGYSWLCPRWELPVLCFSGSGAPDFSVLSILARKARRLVLERKEELLTWFCVGWLPMPCCRSCLQPWVNCLGTDVPLWVWAERCYGQMGRWGTKMIWQDLWWRKEHNRHWLKKRKIIVLSSTMLILLFSMKST